MTRTHKVLLILGLTIFGVWGCGKSNSANTQNAAAAKIAKLESDLRAALDARDLFRQKFNESQTQARLESHRYQAVVKERDELVVKLQQKTEEHKELQVQYDGFRKNLKDLIGQAEVALAPQSSSVIASPVSLKR